jgi:hypothetical protein
MIVFVFGSNEAGIHGAGAAADALRYYGAQPGKGYGWQDTVATQLRQHDGYFVHFTSFAIPTKDQNIHTLPLFVIERYIRDFIRVAKMNPQDDFQVTRIGCGLAGYTDTQIAPFFAGAPSNVHLPLGWR